MYKITITQEYKNRALKIAKSQTWSKLPIQSRYLGALAEVMAGVMFERLGTPHTYVGKQKPNEGDYIVNGLSIDVKHLRPSATRLVVNAYQYENCTSIFMCIEINEVEDKAYFKYYFEHEDFASAERSSVDLKNSEDIIVEVVEKLSKQLSTARKAEDLILKLKSK